MEKIASFTVNHDDLLRGVYLSRQDSVGGGTVTTFDIRMKEPNREPVIDIAALHSIEHIGATILRNNPEWGSRTIYFGPMGCRTGFYLLLNGDLKSRDIVGLVTDLFRQIADFPPPVPGAAARDCGNWLNHDLPMARWEAKKFLAEVLQTISEANLVYPA